MSISRLSSLEPAARGMQGGAGGEERGEPGRRDGPGRCANAATPGALQTRASRRAARRAVGCQGNGDAAVEPRGAETGKGCPARGGKARGGGGGDGGTAGTAEASSTRPRAPRLTSRGSPSGLPPRQPGGGGMDSGAAGTAGSPLPRQRVRPQRVAATRRRARAAEPHVSADPRADVTSLPRDVRGRAGFRVVSGTYLWSVWKVRERVVLL